MTWWAWPAASLFIRNAGGLCFVQLAAGDGTTIQAMLSKKQIGADSSSFSGNLRRPRRPPVRQRPCDRLEDRRAVDLRRQMGHRSEGLQPLPTLQKELNEDTRTRKPYIGMIADEKIRNMVPTAPRQSRRCAARSTTTTSSRWDADAADRARRCGRTPSPRHERLRRTSRIAPGLFLQALPRRAASTACSGNQP